MDKVEIIMNKTEIEMDKIESEVNLEMHFLFGRTPEM